MTNWAEVLIGAYLLSPLSPEDLLTAGTTVVPSAVAGILLILHGLTGSKLSDILS